MASADDKNPPETMQTQREAAEPASADAAEHKDDVSEVDELFNDIQDMKKDMDEMKQGMGMISDQLAGVISRLDSIMKWQTRHP